MPEKIKKGKSKKKGEILRIAYKLHQKSELIPGGGELCVCNIRSSPGGI